MDNMVVQVLQKCTVCQKVDKGVKTAYAPMEHVPFPEGSWFIHDRYVFELILSPNEYK